MDESWVARFYGLRCKLRANVKNEITLICAKFDADLINNSKVTSRKTEWPRFCATLHNSRPQKHNRKLIPYRRAMTIGNYL